MSEIKLLQGDCLELIKEIPDASVDLVLTDPPYFPEWLRRGETLALAEVGDADEAYRRRLRLRATLNTADGTAEGIIKAVKAFFSSETVHVTPNYPAGIRILHDGWSGGADFNGIIGQTVGAGISYDTRELLDVGESLPAADGAPARVLWRWANRLARGAAMRNGRVLRDGRTAAGWELGWRRRGWRLRRGGSVWRCLARIPADDAVQAPVLRGSGALDGLEAAAVQRLSDAAAASDGLSVGTRSHYFRDGSRIRGGALARKGGLLLAAD